jgi:hypothetical protein
MISLAETLSFMLTAVCTTNSQINRDHSGCLARLRCGARLSGSWQMENRKIADPSHYCPPTWVFVHGGCLPDNVRYRNEFVLTCPNQSLADFGLFLVMPQSEIFQANRGKNCKKSFRPDRCKGGRPLARSSRVELTINYSVIPRRQIV